MKQVVEHLTSRVSTAAFNEFIRLALVAAVSIVSAAMVADGDEPVKVDNGDFESGHDNWEGPGVHKVIDDEEHGGTRSLVVESGHVFQPPAAGRLIGIEAGSDYRVSVWIKCDGCGDREATVMAVCRGGPAERDSQWLGKWLTGTNPQHVHDGGRSPAILATGGTHDWKELTTVIPAAQLHAQTQALSLYLRHDAKPDAIGKVWFDDVLVERLVNSASLSPAVPDAADRVREKVDAAKKAAADKDGLEQTMVLAESGQACYAVHVGASPELMVLHAAAELAEYLESISGVSFRPLSHDGNPSTKPLLIVGRHNALTSRLCPDIPYGQLGPDGFVIRTVGPHIVIAGATPRGTMYGVYWLLDRHLGVRWFARDFTCVPQRARMTLKRPTDVNRPRFTYREVFARDGDDEAYRAHNLLNGRSHHRTSIPPSPQLNSWCNQWKDGGHNLHRIVSKQKYGAEHPEYFAGNQLAMMNENVRRIAATTLIEKWKVQRQIVCAATQEITQ